MTPLSAYLRTNVHSTLRKDKLTRHHAKRTMTSAYDFLASTYKISGESHATDFPLPRQ